MNYISKEQLSTFPTMVINDVLNTLKAFSQVTISYEYGKYEVSTGCCLKSRYGSDHKVFGIARAVDMYTEDERTQNYIECFHDYPCWYKGRRNYTELRERYGESSDMD
jgi:hypothetical protein